MRGETTPPTHQDLQAAADPECGATPPASPLNDTNNSYATIRCQDKEFTVHKLVLSAHSSTLGRGKTSTGTSEDSTSSSTSTTTTSTTTSNSTTSTIIEMHETSPVIIDAIIFFMYNSHLDGGSDEYLAHRPPNMVFCAQTYAAGAAYSMAGLMDYSKERFQAAVAADWSKHPADLSEAVKQVYATTPATDRTLRDVVVSLCKQNAPAMSATPEFKAGLLETPEFAADLVFDLARDDRPAPKQQLLPGPVRWMCPYRATRAQARGGESVYDDRLGGVLDCYYFREYMSQRD